MIHKSYLFNFKFNTIVIIQLQYIETYKKNKLSKFDKKKALKFEIYLIYCGRKRKS